jgi:hypothetical protein
VDLNKNAFRIVKALSGERTESERSKAARVAGQRGGAARANTLSAERRREIAINANLVRWKGKGK